MNRHLLSLSREQLTSFALEAFVTQAKALNQHHRETFTTRFPKGPSRWLSHYAFTPRPIGLTREGDIDGGLRDKGRRYRELAGLHDHIPGQDDFCHFRYRVGDEVVHKTLAVMVELLRTFGLIKGELLSTDGPLEPTYARYKGCAYACEGCQQFPVDEAGQHALRDQLHRGAKRLQLPCPFPEVVDTVRKATAKQGNPRDPMVTLFEIETVPDGVASSTDRQQVATLLGLPPDQVPPVRLTGLTR